jgi:hypothetical protein
VILVVPADVLPGRHYRAQAIALALLLFGLLRWSAPAVRAVVSTWRVVGDRAASGWLTLRRWIRAALSGTLWVGIRSSPEGHRPQAQAERATSTLVAWAPVGAQGSLASLACLGALHRE